MAKKNKKQKAEKSRLEIPAVAIIDNIVFSKKEAWAYYKINTVPYDFLDMQAKIGLGNSTNVALSSLLQNGSQQLDCHILITNTPFNVNSWKEQMEKIYDEWNSSLYRSRTFVNFIDSQSAALKEVNYKKRVTYLGIKLFTRGSFSFDNFNILEFGLSEAYQSLKKAINAVLRVPTEEITSFEEKKAIAREKEIKRTLDGGRLRSSRVSSEELLLLTKKQLHPAMPSPYLETNHSDRIGLSDITLETVSVIENKHRCIKVNQVVDGKEYEGYRATLSFAKFPKSGMGMPSAVDPFLYFPTMQGLPFTMNARFTLIPTEKARKELDNKKLETDDEMKNLAESGQGMTAHVAETLGDIGQMELELDERQPWVSGSYRITIEMPTFEALSNAVSEIKQEYAQSDIILAWTSGDQLDLLLEEMPGGSLKMISFNQMTNLSMIGTSGFNFGGIAGDPISEKLVLNKKEAK